jgi:hypothetical protein
MTAKSHPARIVWTLIVAANMGCILPLALAQSDAPAGAEAAPKGLSPKRVLTGEVVDHLHQPVQGATVYAVHAAGGFITYAGADQVNVFGGSMDRTFLFFKKTRNLSTGEIKTTEQGRFSFSRLKKGRFHLLVVHPERGMQVVPSVKMPNADDPARIVLQPPNFVHGKIIGASVASGTLRTEQPMPWQPKAQADEEVDFENMPRVWIEPRFKIEQDGAYRAGPLPLDGVWTLELDKPVPKRRFIAKLLSMPVHVRAAEETPFNLDFGVGEKIQGQIRGPDKKPLADVAVEVSSEKDGLTHRYGALTNPEGEFTIRGIPSGSYALAAYRHVVSKGPG